KPSDPARNPSVTVLRDTAMRPPMPVARPANRVSPNANNTVEVSIGLNTNVQRIEQSTIFRHSTQSTDADKYPRDPITPGEYRIPQPPPYPSPESDQPAMPDPTGAPPPLRNGSWSLHLQPLPVRWHPPILLLPWLHP